MEEDKTIEENVDIFLRLIADLDSLKVSISDEDHAIQLLSGLPAAYEPLVHTLQYGSGKETLTVNEVVTSAYSKEAELRQKGLLNKSRQVAEGLYVESRGRSDKQGGSPKNKSRSKSKQKFDKNNTGCFICGSEDHWKRECPERKKPPNSANIAVEPKQPIVLTVSTQDSKKEWVMDSAITYGNIKGIGKIRIQNPDGSEVILRDVKYIPEVSRNLISYGMLERSGCRYEGRNFKVRFYKGGKKAISGKYKDGLYYLEGKVSKNEENNSGVEKEVRQERSKKVTFGQNLVQEATPNGLEKDDSLAQGGDSKETESKESNEESGIKELEVEGLEKVSKILGMGIFGDRAKEEETLSKIYSNEEKEDFPSKAVPGQKLQVCCKFPSLN
ncbi:unnamed protein product [Microthlaspi erraticum]|nr:unnamed protein product [Microthlaspi erraticum]